MPAVDDFVTPNIQYFGEPQIDVSALYVPTPDYVVLGLNQIERIRPTDSKVVPTIEVSFRVPGLPGTFTIKIDNYAFTHADVLGYMRARSYLLRAIYALPNVLPPFVDTGPAVTV